MAKGEDQETSPRGDESIESLLEDCRPDLQRIVRRQASGLLHYESVDDLVQGVHVHVIQVLDHFEYRGRREFVAWLATIAKQHIADRYAYWTARKRDAGKLLRITSGDLGSRSRAGGVQPAGVQTGPSTAASRKEELELAMKAVSVLPARDQELILWMCEDLSTEAMAERLGTTAETAGRALRRARDRFRKTFEALARGS